MHMRRRRLVNQFEHIEAAQQRKEQEDFPIHIELDGSRALVPVNEILEEEVEDDLEVQDDIWPVAFPSAAVEQRSLRLVQVVRPALLAVKRLVLFRQPHTLASRKKFAIGRVVENHLRKGGN